MPPPALIGGISGGSANGFAKRIIEKRIIRKEEEKWNAWVCEQALKEGIK